MGRAGQKVMKTQCECAREVQELFSLTGSSGIRVRAVLRSQERENEHPSILVAELEVDAFHIRNECVWVNNLILG